LGEQKQERNSDIILEQIDRLWSSLQKRYRAPDITDTLEEPTLPISTVEREAVAMELLREKVPIFRTDNFAKPEVMVRMKYGN
jgi:hypothetical protein